MSVHTIQDLQEIYEARYDEPISYHAVYFAMTKKRIPSFVLANRHVVQTKDYGNSQDETEKGTVQCQSQK